MLLRCAICGTLPSVHSATVHILHRMCTSGKVRRLACPLRRFPFICPTELRGWQRNWIHRGAPRPANPVTCFPPGKVVAPATKGGIAEMRQEEYGSTSPASTPCFPLRWHASLWGKCRAAAKGCTRQNAAMAQEAYDSLLLPSSFLCFSLR